MSCCVCMHACVWIPESAAEPHSLEMMLLVRCSSTIRLNWELGQRRWGDIHEYKRCWDILSCVFVNWVYRHYSLLWPCIAWMLACGLKPKPPFLLYVGKKKSTQCTPHKTSLHMRSLSSSPLMVLWHNRHRDEEEKTKTNYHISHSWNANIMLLFLKRYKRLISISPLQDKPVFCLCFFLLLCLTVLWRVVSELTGLISW